MASRGARTRADAVGLATDRSLGYTAVTVRRGQSSALRPVRMRLVPCVESVVEGVQPRPGDEALGVAVPVRLPSGVVIMIYRPDLTEHVRRSTVGAGPVCDTSLLATLWELPAGLPVPMEVLPWSVRDPVLFDRGLVTLLEGGLVCREYETCGVVTSVFAVGSTADIALRRASELSPIFSRSAVVTGRIHGSEWERIVGIAERCALGVIALDPLGGELMSIPPPVPVVGRPHIYRWWVAEMAYASWLAREAPTSSVGPWTSDRGCRRCRSCRGLVPRGRGTFGRGLPDQR